MTFFERYKMRFLLLKCTVLSSLFASAQDPQFSQFYANPVYLNPAFTGMTYQHRIVANYRNQWAGISKAFSTYALSYDNNVNERNLGLGLQVMNDNGGTTNLNYTNVAANVSWHGDLTRFTELRGGVSVSYNMLRINTGRLLFNDQLYYGTSTTAEQTEFLARNYLDFHAGVLINSVNYWAGLSTRHLSRPDVDLSRSGSARLPMTVSLHGGYRFVFEKLGRELKEYVSPVMHIRHQHKFDQMDLGVYYYRVPFQIGLWYRGLPLKKYASGFGNHDALVILAGFESEKNNLKFGYSYDFPLSTLITNTSGSHELSVIYELAKKSRKNRRVLISTPKF